LGVNGRLWNWLKTAVCEVGKRPFVMLDVNGRLWGWCKRPFVGLGETAVCGVGVNGRLWCWSTLLIRRLRRFTQIFIF